MSQVTGDACQISGPEDKGYSKRCSSAGPSIWPCLSDKRVRVFCFLAAAVGGLVVRNRVWGTKWPFRFRFDVIFDSVVRCQRRVSCLFVRIRVRMPSYE